ncbi:hypothetical protein [Paenibacillus sp. Marseille-Q4541]|uniref:hypothetical protein n=1 Tax=Paenibacillus sp. Marseille-Q4541 TaxID=2831522 RepID=UPI001BAD3015|nr:hypothetical protein [Paenibacillus sp. Marseille-Q4541]
MSYKDKYIARDNAYGVDVRSRIVSRNRDNINSTITQSPSYYQVNVLNKTVPCDMLIIDNSDSKDLKNFAVPFDSEFSLGDTIHWKDNHWLAIHFDEMSEVYKRGILRKCFTTLKWLNSEGKVKETWFTYSGESTSNFGVDEGRFIVLDKDRRQIIIKNDKEISNDLDNDSRFIFDDRAWKVTSIDRLESNLMYLVLNADQINTATDNVELRIANYYGNIATHEINVLSGTSLTLSPNFPLQLQVEVRNRDQIVPSPTLSFSSKDESICTVNQNGLLTPISEGLTSIIVQFKDIQSVISVKVVQEQTYNYTVEIIDDSSNPFVIYRGKSKEFKAVFKDNGIAYEDNGLAYEDNGLFSLTTNLATITLQGDNRCVLQANSVGKVTLKVVGSHAETTKEITIKSIL